MDGDPGATLHEGTGVEEVHVLQRLLEERRLPGAPGHLVERREVPEDQAGAVTAGG